MEESGEYGFFLLFLFYLKEVCWINVSLYLLLSKLMQAGILSEILGHWVMPLYCCLIILFPCRYWIWRSVEVCWYFYKSKCLLLILLYSLIQTRSHYLAFGIDE